jgi:hypothetical protein
LLVYIKKIEEANMAVKKEVLDIDKKREMFEEHIKSEVS